jgi:Tol biopolymer transport system component
MHQQDPAWSSQGLIAFRDNGLVCVRPDGGSFPDSALSGLWILDPETLEKRRLLPDGYSPAWAPDGQQLAFEADFQIYTVSRDGTALRRLTESGENFLPAWSPDGDSIAYETFPSAIWVMAADGSGRRLLVPTASMADWHPDGQRLVCVGAWDSAGTELRGILTFDLRTAVKTLLWRAAPSVGFLRFPRYSPDGRRIAFDHQDPSEAVPHVWVMNADGTSPRRLTPSAGSQPTWSPTGDAIAFTKEDWMRNEPTNGVLWILELASGRASQLTQKWPERCPYNSGAESRNSRRWCSPMPNESSPAWSAPRSARAGHALDRTD